MNKLFNEEMGVQVTEILSKMVDPITIRLFVPEKIDEPSEVTKQLFEELKEFNEKINLEVLVLEENLELAAQYDYDKAPSFVILDDKLNDVRVRFKGVPLGHEINSLLTAMLEISHASNHLPKEVTERIKNLSKPANIKVFVTTACPHCPGAVQKAHQLAQLNGNIVGEMIEVQTFNELAMKYNVSSVPKIVINETNEFVGNQPIEEFIRVLESL